MPLLKNCSLGSRLGNGLILQSRDREGAVFHGPDTLLSNT